MSTTNEITFHTCKACGQDTLRHHQSADILLQVECTNRQVIETFDSAYRPIYTEEFYCPIAGITMNKPDYDALAESDYPRLAELYNIKTMVKPT